MIEQTPTSIEHEPFITPWFMFYILLILLFTGLVVYSKVRATYPENEEEFVKAFIDQYLGDPTIIIWGISTIVFFVIYGMWNL